jgi:histone H3/H4
VIQRVRAAVVKEGIRRAIHDSHDDDLVVEVKGASADRSNRIPQRRQVSHGASLDPLRRHDNLVRVDEIQVASMAVAHDGRPRKLGLFRSVEGDHMPVMSVATFQRFFRTAGGLNVDKDDLKRYNDFLQSRILDLLIAARAIAKANGRDIVQPADLPITAGLQERVGEFQALDEEFELSGVLDQLIGRPPDLDLSEETDARLPLVAGGLSVALARLFNEAEPELKNLQTRHWGKGVCDLRAAALSS